MHAEDWGLAWIRLKRWIERQLAADERKEETDPHYHDPRIEVWEEVLEEMRKREPR